MPLSAFNRPGNDETTHQVQWHSLFQFIFIQRPLSIPHILREMRKQIPSTKSHILALPNAQIGDPGLVFRSHMFFRKKQHMNIWTYDMMNICSVHYETVHFSDSEIRKGFALIPDSSLQVSQTASFSSCHLSQRIPYDKDLQKGIKHNSFETRGGSLKWCLGYSIMKQTIIPTWKISW